MRPIVTALIDTYNHERFIEEAVVSVLEQGFARSDVEILVVDDGSTDRTAEIVRKFEPRVRLLLKPNGGQASAFNAGIPKARGEIVAFLDGDDWWAKNKLTRVVETMSRDPSLGTVGHGITVVHPDGHGESEILLEGFRFKANTCAGALLFRLRKSLLGSSRLAMRTNVLKRIGSVPEQLTVEADEYLFTLGAVLADVEILPDVLTFYRLHSQNGFQITASDPDRARRKMEILSVLAKVLPAALCQYDIEPKAFDALVEVLRAEAMQARLMLEGGWPWQTVKTEWMLFRSATPHAPISHYLFKLSSSALAFTLPPKVFYNWRRWFTASHTYRRTRRLLFPHHKPSHVEHVTHTVVTRQCGS